MSNREIVSTSQLVPLADIGELEPDQYVGLINVTAVESLMVRLAAEGLKTPIWLRRNGNAARAGKWSVIAGRHRLRAAAALGWTHIDGTEKAGPTSNTTELRRLQIVENLDRRDLRPIERAMFVMDRWREAADRLAPRVSGDRHSRASRVRWDAWEAASHASAADLRAVDQATGEQCGKSDRWVRTHRAIFDGIVAGLPEHFGRLNTHPIGARQADVAELASLPLPKRVAAADAIIARPQAESLQLVLVDANLRQSTGYRNDPNKHGDAFISAFEKIKGPGRRVALLDLADRLTPSDLDHMVEFLKRKGVVSDRLSIA